MKKQDRYFVVNYNFDGQHVRQTLFNGVIGIPSASRTNGKNILNKLTSEKPGYGVIYDVTSQTVRGFFSTLGKAYINEAETFTTADEAGTENWAHRIDVMSHMSPNKSISREAFLEMGGKTNKGSVCRIPEACWIRVKEFFSAEPVEDEE